MARFSVVVLSVLALAVPAAADVTLKQVVNGKGLGLSGESTGTTYIKGHRMRTEMQVGGKVHTTIFDLDAQQMIVLDPKKKKADVWDMASVADELAKTVDTAHMKASLTPNGRTKPVAGATAAGYDVEISMPATMAASPDMSMLVTLSGQTWIVKGAPGTPDYLGFYEAAAEKGWVLSDPRAAKASPGPARAMVEMYRQLAKAGGIPYETDLQIRMSATGGGGNPLAGMLARIGNVSSASTVLSIDTGALDDELFVAPAGYKLNARK